MFDRSFRASRIAALLICVACFCTHVHAQRCGKERWAVKTGTDGDALNVNLASPQNTTIAQLIALAPPSPIPANNRFAPTEDTVFVVSATLTDYKLEGGSAGDSDYHLVLQDDQGNTMVAEIPSPACVGDASPFATRIATARAAFDAQLTATTSFQTANVPVQITGVGFFDFPHGQHGAAPNVIELHPVLDIVFNPSASSPDFTMSVAPSAIAMVQGSSTSSTISTISATSIAPVLTISGMPTGVSSKITSTGPGKATLSLMTAQAAPTGLFPLTITGTANGKSHSITTQLNISPFSPAPGTQQWEYKIVTANSEQNVIDQANALGAEEWELVSVVKVQGANASWRAFFKRPKNNF